LKTELSSFDIAVLINELNQTIKNAYIDNIYQLNPNTLLLRLRQPAKPPSQLLVEAGKRLHLTAYTIKKPQKPTAFCMALRKHLTNGKILGLQQHEFERTVTISMGTREGNFQLVTELFGEGNIILVNPQNVVLYALAYRRMRDRNILRGESFKHAPSSGRNPLNLSRLDLDELKSFGDLEVVRALTKLVSIGGLYAEEVLLRARVEKTSPCKALTEQGLDRIFTQLRTLLAQLSEAETKPSIASIVVNERGEWVDATPIRLEKYAHLKHVAYKTFNEALDEYFTQAEAMTRASKAEKELERELSKLNRVLQEQQKTMEETRRSTEQNKRVGDLIHAHLGELQLLLQKIVEGKQSGKAWEQMVSEIEQEKRAGQTPAVYFLSLDSKRRVLNVSVAGADLSLDISRSVQANASNYYERAKKAQRRLEGARKAMLETQAKIRELRQKEAERVEEVLEVPSKRKERAWYEKFRWFHSSDRFLVIGGRDATTNEILIKKYTQPHDIVFHADILGASFVVIKTEGKTPPEQTIREAAQLAASYSNAWREMLGAVDVYWVRPEQVSKSPPPGQYLARGAFMIHGAKSYIRKIPLRLAIGVLLKEEEATVIGGPTEAIAKQTRVFAEIVSGQQKSSVLAKQLRQLLAKKVSGEWQRRILEIPLEEIQRFIPSGRGTVMLKS